MRQNVKKMDKNNTIILVLFGIVVLALIVFLIWKNQKDKKLLNPDAEDAVNELHMDQERKADKL
jgi:flagellar biosynthesis/type III secretory pathway M-ring protein FliF/YscJ